MALDNLLVDAFKLLTPPPAADQDAQARWRWVVFSAIVGLSAALSMHIALACGYFPSVHSGFALATDEQKVQKRVDWIAMLSIEREIRSKTSELCREKDEVRRFDLGSDIDKLQHEYKEISGDWYKVPGCDRL